MFVTPPYTTARWADDSDDEESFVFDPECLDENLHRNNEFTYAKGKLYDYIAEFGKRGAIPKRCLAPLFEKEPSLHYIMKPILDAFCALSKRLVFDRCGGPEQVVIHIIKPEYKIADFSYWEPPVRGRKYAERQQQNRHRRRQARIEVRRSLREKQPPTFNEMWSDMKKRQEFLINNCSID